MPCKHAGGLLVIASCAGLGLGAKGNTKQPLVPANQHSCCQRTRLPFCFCTVLQVEEFMLWDLDRVAGVISGSDDYKPNCCLVIIDFLIRHGCITPEEPGYLDLVRSLRVGDPL